MHSLFSTHCTAVYVDYLYVCCWLFFLSNCTVRVGYIQWCDNWQGTSYRVLPGTTDRTLDCFTYTYTRPPIFMIFGSNRAFYHLACSVQHIYSYCVLKQNKIFFYELFWAVLREKSNIYICQIVHAPSYSCASPFAFETKILDMSGKTLFTASIAV